MAEAWKLPTDRMPTEHEEQIDFVRWFRRTYSPVRIFAIPNGGERKKAEAMRLKAEGVSKGVLDLFVPEWSLWIEMKKQKGGVISAEQHDWSTYLQVIGHSVIFGYGSVDAQQKVANFRNCDTLPKPANHKGANSCTWPAISE